MKKFILSFLAASSLILAAMGSVANAAPITPVSGGGTQTSSIQNGYLLIGNPSGTYNQIASSSLSGGSSNLTSTYIGYGNASNTITGTSTFTFSSGQLLIQNLEGVRYADQFPGTDMNAQIQNAYTSLCAGTTYGGTIFVPSGQYTSTSSISISTYPCVAIIQGAGGGGFYANGATTLIYNGTGTEYTYNEAGFSSAGIGLKNISLVGPAGVAGIGSSTIGSSYGVKLGGASGAFGWQMDGVQISGFGTGLYVGSNVSFMNITNSVIQKNGRDIDSPSISGANGENMRVSNSIIADCNSASGQGISAFCVDVQLSGNVQWTFNNTSFDDAQIYSNQYGGTANIWNFTDDHFEDPNTGANCYDRILTQPTFAGAAAVVINVKGGDFMEDKTSGACNEFIAYGGTLILNGVTGDLNNNVTVPMQDFANPLNNQATISWNGLIQSSYNTSAATGFTYVYASTTYSPDGLGFGSSTAAFSFTTSTATFGSTINLPNLSTNAFAWINGSGNLTTTSTPSGGGGGVATTTLFSAGYLPVTSSSLALTNSIIYQTSPIASTTTYSVPVLKNSCKASNAGTGKTTLGCSLGTVTTGDLIVIIDQPYTGAGAATVTNADSQSNSYTKATDYTWQSGTSRGNIFYSANVTGGASFNVTSTFSTTSTYSSMFAYEYSGIATTSPLDAVATSSPGNVSGAFSVGPLTTTMAGDLLIGEANCGGGCSLTAGAGMTTTGTSTNNAGLIEATTTGAAGSYSANFTESGGLIATGASMITFKPSVSSTTPFVPAEIGINTTAPSSTLSVNGSIQATGSSTIITPSIGGAITTSGCDSATSSVAGYGLSSTTTGFFTTPENYPGPVSMYTMLTTASTITTYVCADITITPTSTAYIVKIIQ